MGDRIWIANARIVDVARGVALPPSSVLVKAGRIADVTASPPAEARGFDAAGLYLAPGLIDGHVHFCFDCGTDPRGSFLASDEQALWETGRRNAETAIRSSITTVRDCGAPTPWIFEFERAVASSAILGPNILACGRPLTRPAGHLHYLGGEVATRQQVRSLVEQQARAGARFVKLIASGGGLTPGTRPGEADLPLELMREATDVARGLRMQSAAHCHATESIVRAIDAGVDIVEHASFISGNGEHRFSAEIAARLADCGTIVCPTVIGAVRTVRRFRQSSRRHNADDATAITRLEARRSNLARFYRLRLPLLGGTDCGITDTPFDSLIDELILCQQAGMTAAEALRTATCDSARYLNLGRTGEIRSGYAADLVLLDGNPLDDLACLRAPVAVMKAGRFVVERREIARAEASASAAAL